MRSRLRLFATVGVFATAVDLGLYLALASWSVLGAEVVALSVAAFLAYALNRTITFRGNKSARWVRHPGTFALVALLAGTIDLFVVALGVTLGVPNVVHKVVAIGVAALLRWAAYRWVLFTEVRREMATRQPRPPSTGTHHLSVVVPAFNEEAAIGSTVKALRVELQTIDQRAGDQGGLEIVVVDDGSADRTAEVAAAAGARVLKQQHNQGKGAAIRRGVIEADGQFVIFTDADLAYPAAMIWPILAELEAGWDVVVGSRRHEETTTLVRARKIRELGGRVVNWFTHLVLLGHFRDTQCGIKGFRGDIGRSIFERTRVNGFAFDVEVFLIAEQDHFSLTEVPVRVENRQGSSVRIVRDTAKLVRDLFRIRRAAGRGEYQPIDNELVGA